MQLAYLINQYPKGSHSFIRREIEALERLGQPVMRYAIRSTKEELVDPADQAELAKTRVILNEPAWTNIVAILASFAAAPLAFLTTALLAWRLGRRSHRGRLMHLAYLLEAAILCRWCKHAGVAHIHAHFGTNSTTVAMLAAKMSRLRFSFTVHGPEEFDKPEAIALPAKIAAASFVVGVSSFGRSQLQRWSDYRHWRKLHIVHCGLDAKFTEHHPAPPAEQTIFVSVGRLTAQKGQLLLVDAAAALRDLNIAFSLRLVGDGPMRHAIESHIAELDLGSRVTITGWVSSDGVRAEIERARALVMPSFGEGLPVVIMEAMALERPVISTYIAGIPELVVPGKSGWLVPAGDTMAVAAAMREVAQLDPHQYAAMGRMARERVLANHNAIVEAGKLKTLFEASETEENTMSVTT